MRLDHIDIGYVYKNLKKKTDYLTIAWAVHSEDGTTQIVYVGTDKSNLKQRLALWLFQIAARLNQNRVWVRPIGLFEEKFIPNHDSPRY